MKVFYYLQSLKKVSKKLINVRVIFFVNCKDSSIEGSVVVQFHVMRFFDNIALKGLEEDVEEKGTER